MTTSNTTKTPALSLIYGGSGLGKTVDCGFSFPNGLYFAAPNALASIAAVCGYKPSRIDVSDITDLTNKLKQLIQKGSDYDSFVVDDLSFLHERELQKWEKKNSTNAFYKFQKANDAMLEFRNVARYAGKPVAVNCWERHPSSNNGAFKKGGPQLTGKLGEAVPNMFDIVLQAGIEPTRKPWTGIYKCSNDPSWVMKDRFNVAITLKKAPMNLAEILRAAGHKISRLENLDWQEESVESISKELLSEESSDTYKIANEHYARLVSKGIDHRFASWTVRDALDRTVITRGLTKSQSTFF